MVARVCGTPEDKFLKVCEMLASTAAKDRAGTILYALGWTQHSIGAQIIRTGAMVQLLLGNIGIPGGGMNRSEEHTSELQSLMRISYAVFCLKKKKKNNDTIIIQRHISKIYIILHYVTDLDDTIKKL